MINDDVHRCILKIKNNEIFESGEDLRVRILDLVKARINFLANNYKVPGMDRDDLSQELKLCVLNAIRSFDLNRNIKFSTYVSKALLIKIYSLTRKNRRQKRIINTFSFEDVYSLDNKCGSRSDWKIYNYSKYGKKEKRPIDKIKDSMIFQNLRKKLKEWEEIALDMAMKGFTYDEIRIFLFTNHIIKISLVSIANLFNKKCKRLVENDKNNIR